MICTLFEGDHHFGAGALCNSLYSQHYRGAVWLGFRGEQPFWSQSGEKTGSVGGQSPDVFLPATGLTLHLKQVDTEWHLTNYKVKFMQETWGKAKDESRLFYFDPDISVKCRWSFFEEWADGGVALCEDINSPMPLGHPRRAAWIRQFGMRGLPFVDKTERYVNGGFVGLARRNESFLDHWRIGLDIVEANVGSLAGSQFSFDKERAHPSNPYSKTDQDALNMAVMLFDGAASIMGREAMDFKPGGWTMCHALGPAKPWRRNYLRDALVGRPPGSADKEFWRNVQFPIRLFSPSKVRRKQWELRVAAAMGKFYRGGVGNG